MAKRIRKPALGRAKSSQFSGRTPARSPVAGRNAARDVVRARSERIAAKDNSLDRRSVPATQAKNRFGEILQAARDLGPVFIERHGQAQVVVLGIDAYNKLASNERSSQERELDYWTREFQVLHARMQTRKARQAVDALFSATDAELNRRDS
jgi:prevent-host-death family protein